MVCCANSLINSQPSEDNSQQFKTKKMDEMSESTSDDDLKLNLLAGGSIVHFPPLFSPDGELLFIIFRNKVEIYSATTAELVRNLEGPKDAIVALQYDLGNDKYLWACSKTGELIKWMWKSGSVESEGQLNLYGQTCIETFHLLNTSSECALVTYRARSRLNWGIVEISSSKVLNCPIKIKLTDDPVCVAVDNKHFHYFVIAQGHSLCFVNYKSWKLKWGLSAHQVPITCVQTHPTQEVVTSGDEVGRVFMWRQLWDKDYPRTTLYHWHHTPVSSIAFTAAGSSFYSGAKESVLVKWHLDTPDERDYVPRMSADLLHISVSQDNRKVAVSTKDNAVHILDAQNKPICVLQNFTEIYDDRTGLRKCPIGLQLDPQKNCLVTNGRVGCLQFFSTHTKRFLYNMDIVMQNKMSAETDKVLYDIRVTCAALNVDWMVTGEVWDDQEHSPEVRLKFWQYQKNNQSYNLNTNVELAHEGGFEAIEFSSQHEIDNLLCATVGKDNVIKMWALEDSDNIYKKVKVWICIGAITYKSMPIQSIKFSQDGSLLAAGFGNNLCIFNSESLKLKSVLSAPSGYDGTLQKVQICLPKNIQNSKSPKKSDSNERRKKVLQLFKEMLENNGDELIQYIKKSRTKVDKKIIECLPNLNAKQEEMLFRKIQSMKELNLFQKLTLYQKLEIFCSVPEESKGKMLKYINSTLDAAEITESHLLQSVRDVCSRHRFKAKYRLHKYISRKANYSTEANSKLVPLLNLLKLNGSSDNKSSERVPSSEYSHCNGFMQSEVSNGGQQEQRSQQENVVPPVQKVSSIKSVHFGTREFGHFVVVCTKHRVLIWNLLTLKLQCVLKLSVHKMVVDPLTSLFAAFTKKYELYVFLPNAPMIIYRRAHLPKIHGACWVPRRYPKSQSTTIDWQSMSTLYFFTDKQELMYLAAENDVEFTTSTGVSFMNEAQETTKYSVFGAFAMKQINAKAKQDSNSSAAFSIGVPGKSAAKRLTEMSTHAMAPVSFLCNGFVKSLMEVEVEEKSKQTQRKPVANDEDKESDDEIMEIGRRKASKRPESTGIQTNTDFSRHIKQDDQLRRILDKEKVNFNF